ncbi:ATPase inhibitor, mitochondrial-like [Cylas formicarius]|uniref:ATPase inhibitor, mitochondrial-like n=1 Tax=Cylas formicarius TaxID=197179 RepID=UPI002958B072|nr:ATPase inhibitor, mitochondrial-like [Cylas formicarius]
MKHIRLWPEKVDYVFRRACSKKYDTGMLGDLGKGAGKGGGGGGAVRDAGGPFGKMGAAREEEYFYHKQRELIAKLKDQLEEENRLREAEITRHRQAIEENKEAVKKIEESLSYCDDKVNNKGRR